MTPPVSPTPLRVLLVEESPRLVEQIADMLAGQPNAFVLDTATSLNHAQGKLAVDSVDVILASLTMPGDEGLTAIRVMRQAAPRTPVVALTGSTQSHLEQTARLVGAADVLGKDELQPRLLSRVLQFAADRAAYAQRLQTSERLNRRIIEQAQDAIYRTDPEGRFTYLNPAVQTITGYSPKELSGISFLSLVALEHRERVLAHYRRQLAEETPSTYLEFPITTKDGQECWVGQNVWLAKEPGMRTGFEAIARDITELRLALESLEYSRHQLEERVRQRTRQLEKAKLDWERTFDAVPDLILITDPDMKISRVNRAVAKRLQREPKELVGASCDEIMPGMAGLDSLCVIPDGQQGDSEFSREIRDDKLGGDFLVSTSTLLDGEGKHQGHVHVARDITPLKQAERTTREQLLFLQLLIDTMPNPVFFKDRQGHYTGSNIAFQTMLGLSAEELMSKQVREVLDPEQAAFFSRKDRELLDSGGVQVFETTLTLPGQPSRHVINSKAVLRNSEGEIDGLVGVIQDISELREAERALRSSEEQFRTLFELAPISLWEEDFSRLKKHLDNLKAQGVTDLASHCRESRANLFKCASLIKVINVNAHTLQLFAAESKNELLHNLDKILTEESLPAFEQEMLALDSGLTKVSVTGYNRTLKGKKLYLLINLIVPPGSEHTWDRVLISIQDLTERLEAETALRESERRYRSLVEALSEGLLQVDEEARILFGNKRFLEMTGYSEEELIGHRIFTLLDERNAARLEAQFDKRKLGGHDNYELTLLSKSGQSVDALISPRPIFDAEGNFRGSYSLITDITDRKKLELQLRQSQKMEAIGQLAAGIAHEINTPTQYVASNSRFLQEGFEDLSQLQQKAQALLEKFGDQPEMAGELVELKDFCQEIDLEFLMDEIPKALEANIEGLERIAIIVRSMKDFAHPGKEEKQQVDLNQILETTVTVARNEWKYVAEVETDLDPNLPMVTCVANEIKQVFLNIVVNAAQAIGEVVTEGVDHKGRIRITSREENDHAVVAIVDSGPGIPSQVLERIFDPFFTTKEPGKGTGQGLAIAYRAVVDTHGGTLNVKSEPGEGTAFEIRLPLKET